MKIVDLSATITSDALVFPGYPRPVILPWTNIEKHGYYSNVIHMVEHTLTHVDSPAHFIKDASTIDKVSLDHFMGRAVALDFRDKKESGFITKKDLEMRLRGFEKINIVLLYTGWDEYLGSENYFKGYPGLSKDGAEYLREIGIKAVGIDGGDIDSSRSKGFPVHNTLLPAGIVVYEGLVNLREVIGKVFNFIGLPLKIGNGSASPVRAVAVIE